MGGVTLTTVINLYHIHQINIIYVVLSALLWTVHIPFPDIFFPGGDKQASQVQTSGHIARTTATAASLPLSSFS
jgi:hypothetical protein